MSRRSGRNIQPIVQRPFGFNSDIFSADGSSDEDSVKHSKHSSSGISNTDGLENGASHSAGSSDEGSGSRQEHKKNDSQHSLKKTFEQKHRDGKHHHVKDGHHKDERGHATKYGHIDGKGSSSKDGSSFDGKGHSSMDVHGKDGKGHSSNDRHSRSGKGHSSKGDHSKDGKGHSTKDGHSKDGNSKDGKGHSLKGDHSKDGNSKDGKDGSTDRNSKDGNSKDGNSKDGNSKDGKDRSSTDRNSKDGSSKDGKDCSPMDRNSKDGNSKDGSSKDGKDCSPMDRNSKDGKDHSSNDRHSKDGKDHSSKDGHGKDGKDRSSKDGISKDGNSKDGKNHSSSDRNNKDGKDHSSNDRHSKDGKDHSSKDGHGKDGKDHSSKDGISKDGNSKDGKDHSSSDRNSKDGKDHSSNDRHSKDGKDHSSKDGNRNDGNSKDGKEHSSKLRNSKDGKDHASKDGHSQDGKDHSPKDGHSKDGRSHSIKDDRSKDRKGHSTKDGQRRSNSKGADKGLRRSTRLQNETSFFDRRQTDLHEGQDQTKAKSMYSDVFSDEESEAGSESSSSSNNFSDDERGQKKSKPKTRKQSTSVTSKKPTEIKVHKVRHLSSSTEDEAEEDEDEEIESGSESEWTSSSVEKGQNKSKKRDNKRSSRRQVTQLKISYKEESDNGTDSDDLIELSEQENEDVGSSETIEKVMKSRGGRVGACGSKTTIYNMENDGDPNANLDLENEEVEQQYLIKWKNWSHMHNTWESETTLQEMKVNGLKKLKNFKDREEVQLYWRLAATPEEIEYQDCQDELTDELYLQYCEAERVVTEFPPKIEAESFDYLVKWQGLPYSECTREDSQLIQKRFPEIVEQYKERLRSEAIPNRHCRALKVRPTFHRLQKQPDYIGGPKQLQLRDYQLKGLNWLLHSWCKGNGAILADEMGLGKTIQTISFLSVLMSAHQVYGPFLMIVPLSTVVTWQREFQVWAPQVNVTVYIGDINTRNMIREYEWYERDGKKFKCNVVITTYEIVLKDKVISLIHLKSDAHAYRLDVEFIHTVGMQIQSQATEPKINEFPLPLSEISWAVLGVDEAHRLKNDDSMLYKSLFDFNTNHRLFITGTPLQNSLRELWSLLHFINPKHFEEWEEFEEKHSSADKTGFRYLHKELEPYLLRRVKKDVEKSLPAKVEQILHVEMSRSQRQCYRYILTRNYEALAKGVKGNISGFVNLMMELKKCCNHTSLVIEDYEADDTPEMIVKKSGKLLLLDKLLPRLKESGHRVLIFSQMVRMLDIIANYMKLKGYLFQRLDGTVNSERRRQAMDHFNAEGSQDFCFLLSTRAGGLGVNLVTADTVIIFDSDWNPQNDLQAMARAHRIGQKNQVSVYRLVTKNSVEEEIIERAKKKMVLDHLVIQRMDTSGRTVLDRTGFKGQSSRNPFSKEELNSILKFGAEELFKESDDEDAQVDIDDILKRAETRDTEDFKHSATDDLLSTFKIVKFDNLEDEAMEESPTKRHVAKGWDEIIPEAERQKIEEEKRKRQEAEMQLAPRSRRNMRESEPSDSDYEEGKRKKKKLQRKEFDDDEEDEEEDVDDSEDEEDDRQTRRRGKPREAVKGFTDVELRRFIKSFKKFPHPKKRVADVAEDAELQEKSEADLEHLADLILTNCDQTMKEFEEKQKEEAEASPTADGKKSKARPSFRLGTVTINARSILDAIQDLEPLARLIEPNSKEKICLGENVKKVLRFDCHWTVDDDRNLLKGIYTYGMGNWEAIKLDSELKLSDKILPDYGLKPQARHLRSRTEYLLKILHEQMSGTTKEKIRSGKSNESGKRKRKHNDDVDPHGKHSHSKKHKSHKERRDERPHKSSKQDDSKGKARAPLHFTTKDTVAANISNCTLPKEDYEKCVEMMKPVYKSLLLMAEVTGSGSTDKSHLIDAILLIGNQISTILTEYKNPTEIKEWRNNLWQYVTLFASSTYGIKRLKDLYRYAHDKQENEENRKLQEKQTQQEESTLHYGNHPNANRYGDQNHWQQQKRTNAADSRSDAFRKRQRNDYTQIRSSFRPTKVHSEEPTAQQNTESTSRLSPTSSNQVPTNSQPTNFRYRKDGAMGQQRNPDRCYPSPPSDAPLHPYYGRDVPPPGPLPSLPPTLPPPPASVHFNSPLDAQHYPQPTWYGDNSLNSYSRPLPPPPHPPHPQYGYNRHRKPFTSNEYPNETSSKQGQRRRQDNRFSGQNRRQPYAYQSYDRHDNRRSSYRDDRHFGHTAPSSDHSGDSQEPHVLDLQSTVESTTTGLPQDFSQPLDIPVSSQFSSVPTVPSEVATTSPVQSRASPAYPQDNH